MQLVPGLNIAPFNNLKFEIQTESCFLSTFPHEYNIQKTLETVKHPQLLKNCMVRRTILLSTDATELAWFYCIFTCSNVLAHCF